MSEALACRHDHRQTINSPSRSISPFGLGISGTLPFGMTSADHVYHAQMRITQMIEFGGPLQPMLSGEIPPPASGARFDVHVEGSVTGSKATNDGARLSFFADGLGTVESGSGKVYLHEHVTLHSSDGAVSVGQHAAARRQGIVHLKRMEVEVNGYIEQPG